MPLLVLLIEILTFGFTLWFGLYLLARNPAKPLLRYAGLGLAAYALALAADLASAYTPASARTPLEQLYRVLVLLPVLLWLGALLELLPEEAALRAGLLRWWKRAFLALLALGAALSFAASAGYAALALVLLGLLLAALALVIRHRWARQPQRPFALLLAATLFFTLGVALLVLPLGLLPRSWGLLAIGLDIVLLDLAVAAFDAFDEGESLLPDITRSFVAALCTALLFGLQVVLAMLIGTGISLAMLLLLLAIISAAVALPIFLDPLQSRMDRLVFARAPRLWQARDQARAAASALPRQNDQLDIATIDDDAFIRLTRRALSHYGDLARLATSPLIRLPLIEARLRDSHGSAAGDTLAPAAELKALLAESIARLKPRGQGDFGISDEWRYYNALYFPYVAGLKPYSRRAALRALDPATQQALEWFRATVPERTLYNWQNTAARLVAQDLRERQR